MFDYTHYVPILRWKQGERNALSKLNPSEGEKITPLIELVPSTFPSDKSVNKALAKTAKEVLECWGQERIFVDFCQVEGVCAPDGSHVASAMGIEATRQQLNVVPVTGLSRQRDYQYAVKDGYSIADTGVCIRLCASDLRRPALHGDLLGLVRSFKLNAENVDLVVDYGVTDAEQISLTRLCRLLPDVQHWRTFTVASGAFPKDLSGEPYRKPGEYQVNRTDWLTWKEQVTTGTLPRVPTYSDYTVRSAVFLEPVGLPNTSASVRYTTSDYWLLLRGEGTRNDDGPGFAQYPAHAEMLCDKSEYCGQSYSAGDAYIYEKRQDYDHPGNHSTWIQATVNHHMTFAVRQIASLFES